MMADRYVIEATPSPCPFCGSAGSRLIVDPDRVQCVECGATGPECDPRGRGHVPPRKSVEAWNARRPPSKAPRTRNISRVSYEWLAQFEADGKLALWPKVQAMARELMERRRPGVRQMIRDATYEERATWGECPACHAKHGEPCDPDVGISLGVNIDGRRPSDGVHLGRLQRAPMRVELVARL